MRFLSVLATVTATVLLAVAPSTLAQNKNKPLPFDGRIQSLTVPTFNETYLLHIMKMRPNNTTGNPADYLQVAPKGRSPAYNGDTGVVTIAVDDTAIFKEKYNFRRTEIVQFVEGNPKGTTFFRASIRADEVIQNKYQWQVLLSEYHEWDVYLDFNQTTPKLQFLADSWTLQYETEFKYKTWTNVGIAVHSTGFIDFYASEGDAPLVKVYTTKKALPADKIPVEYEFHIGMLLYSPTPNPKMVPNHQDKLMFSGVTVDKVGPTDSLPASTAPAASTASTAPIALTASTAPAASTASTGSDDDKAKKETSSGNATVRPVRR
jgi:hypothetical protein